MKYFFTLLLFFCTFSEVLFSQCYIESIQISPLNRTLICLKGKNPQFSSALSSDKQSVEITISKAKIADGLLPKTSTGVINSINLTGQNADFVRLQINLTDKRGYSAFLLPMSNCICVEVFDWAKLNAKEDNYRSALLALEDGIYASAKDYLAQSAGKEIPNSAAILGILDMMEGDEYNSLKYLHIAVDNNTNIPDAYSALSQYYAKKGDAQKAKHYKDLYSKNSGLNTFLPILVGGLKPDQIKPNDTLSFLSYGISQVEEKPAEEIKPEKKLTKPHKPAKKNADTGFTDYLPELSPTLFYIILGVGLFVIMLVSTYLKWRKAQLKILIEANKSQPKRKETKFEQELHKVTPGNIVNSAAINKYKANENVAKPTTKQPQKSEYAKNSDEVRKLASMILEKKSGGKAKSAGANDSRNPNLDLALSLQKKQNDIKNKNLRNLDLDNIEQSENIGLSASTLNAKKKLLNLTDSEEEKRRIAAKFKKNDDFTE